MRSIARIAFFAVFLAAGFPCRADLIELIATNVRNSALGFDIVFDDLDGDRLLQIEEIRSFSEHLDPSVFPPPQRYGQVVAVPEIPGFSTAGCATPVGVWAGCGRTPGPSFTDWVFLSADKAGILSADRSIYTYAFVPEPAPVALLVLGIATLGSTHIRRKAAPAGGVDR